MKGQSVCNLIQPERLVGSLFKFIDPTFHCRGRWDDRIQSILVIKNSNIWIYKDGNAFFYSLSIILGIESFF